MKLPTIEQVEAAIVRERGYWQNEDLFKTMRPTQWLGFINASLEEAVYAWKRHDNYSCLRDVLFIAALAEEAIKDCDCPPFDEFAEAVAGLGPWLNYLNGFLDNCEKVPGYAVGRGFRGIRFYCVQIMLQHGLLERSGYDRFCPNCGLQAKRIAKQVDSFWETYWGCDNDCQTKGFTLGNPDYFDLFWRKHQQPTERTFVLEYYQVMQ